MVGETERFEEMKLECYAKLRGGMASIVTL